MVKRLGSRIRKSKFKLQQHTRERGKISLSRYFQEFTAGDKVGLKIQPNVVKGQFHPRFHGIAGTATGSKKGACYEVKIYDGDKEKTVFVHPIHLHKVK